MNGGTGYAKPATPRELFVLRTIRLCLEAALWFMFVTAVVVYCKVGTDLASAIDAMPLWRMAAMALAGCGLSEFFHAIRTRGSWLHGMLIPPVPRGPVAWAGMGADELRDAIRREADGLADASVSAKTAAEIGCAGDSVNALRGILTRLLRREDVRLARRRLYNNEVGR